MIDRSLRGVLELPAIHLGRRLSRVKSAGVDVVYARSKFLLEGTRISWLWEAVVGFAVGSVCWSV